MRTRICLIAVSTIFFVACQDDNFRSPTAVPQQPQQPQQPQTPAQPNLAGTWNGALEARLSEFDPGPDPCGRTYGESDSSTDQVPVTFTVDQSEAAVSGSVWLPRGGRFFSFTGVSSYDDMEGLYRIDFSSVAPEAPVSGDCPDRRGRFSVLPLAALGTLWWLPDTGELSGHVTINYHKVAGPPSVPAELAVFYVVQLRTL